MLQGRVGSCGQVTADTAAPLREQYGPGRVRDHVFVRG